MKIVKTRVRDLPSEVREELSLSPNEIALSDESFVRRKMELPLQSSYNFKGRCDRKVKPQPNATNSNIDSNLNSSQNPSPSQVAIESLSRFSFMHQVLC